MFTSYNIQVVYIPSGGKVFLSTNTVKAVGFAARRKRGVDDLSRISCAFLALLLGVPWRRIAIRTRPPYLRIFFCVSRRGRRNVLDFSSRENFQTGMDVSLTNRHR